jgi:hypothetical protein
MFLMGVRKYKYYVVDNNVFGCRFKRVNVLIYYACEAEIRVEIVEGLWSLNLSG